EPALLHLPAGFPGLPGRPGGRHGGGGRGGDDHRRDLRPAAHIQDLLRHRAGGMMASAEQITPEPGLLAGAAGRPARRRKRRRSNSTTWGIVGWVVGILFFFPVLWMVLTSFKTEAQAYTNTPSVVFSPTLSEYKTVFSSGLWPYVANSAFATIVSTLLALPCAFALSLRPVKKTRDVLFFFISTKMLPVVAAIIPIYIAARDLHMLDNIFTLVILYTAMNLPIAVWMMRSFFLE